VTYSCPQATPTLLMLNTRAGCSRVASIQAQFSIGILHRIRHISVGPQAGCYRIRSRGRDPLTDGLHACQFGRRQEDVS
jgi:hypothetical protein